MTALPISKMSRQVRRAHERALIRRTMTKTQRRQYSRLPNRVRREIYYSTLQFIGAEQEAQEQSLQADLLLK